MTKFWEPERLAQAAEQPYAKTLVQRIAAAAAALAEEPHAEHAEAFIAELVALTHTAQGLKFA